MHVSIFMACLYRFVLFDEDGSILVKCPSCHFQFEVKGRSVPQNRSYWLLIVQPLAEHLGLTSEECHDLLKYKFNKEIQVKKLRNGEVEEIPVMRSTTVLTTSEFEIYCSNIRMWASQLGCYLKEPNEKADESWFNAKA